MCRNEEVSAIIAVVNGHKQNRVEELLPWNYVA
jgi:hypothetical protein